MARNSPNRKPLQESGAIFMPYAPQDAEPIDVAQVVEGLRPEYDALRGACLLIDTPHRGTLRVTGDERAAFLNNMITQELSGLTPGRSCSSFWLSRQGRVEADLRLTETGDALWIGVDAHRAAHTASTLGEFIFAEDAVIEDATDTAHRATLCGPRATAALAAASGTDVTLEPDRAATLTIAGAAVTADRWDTAGVPGFELCTSAGDAAAVFAAIRDAGAAHGLTLGGWHAWNIARLEAGTPLYFLDFGPSSIPQETGCFESRVSLTKGCYLGQEVVARLHARGTPKQQLVGLDLGGGPGGAHPMTGDLLYAPDDDAKPVGAVTSATLSPAAHDRAIALAPVRTAHASPGTELVAHTASGTMTATVRAQLGVTPPAAAAEQK